MLQRLHLLLEMREFPLPAAGLFTGGIVFRFDLCQHRFSVFGEAAAAEHQIGDRLIQYSRVENRAQVVCLGNLKVIVTPITPPIWGDRADYPPWYIVLPTPEQAA